ncbi:creatininase family protein [Diaphorobacter ruginosibacter]|uniref:Creatininase family protein n=1 Tax=Diaphorobacter ruginosibacter TaxID=1715720 RepID=A0A7G9RNQ5_9BURK|nr:creatininase family protein [Diaphorobacter ruginosibacter]QNN57230.1 creatininase family protein [Diaphorobacter ruginosibacter]
MTASASHSSATPPPAAAPGASAWPSRHWAEVSAHDFALAQTHGLAAETIAVLPVAAVEQHGPHLPLNVDALLLQGVIDAALPQIDASLPVLFMPPQSIGFSTEHISYPGTLTLSPSTIIALWTELGACVARAGVRKLLLLNGHGGQVSVMDIVARELRVQHGLMVYSASWFSLPLPDDVSGQFSAQEHRFGIHAGQVETSMMLHLAPHLVHMERAQNWRSTSQDRAERFAILGNGRSAKMGWAIEDYNPSGAVGDSASATADQGARVVQAAAASLARLLAELHALESPVGR